MLGIAVFTYECLDFAFGFVLIGSGVTYSSIDPFKACF